MKDDDKPRYYRLLAFGLYIYDDDGASSLKSRDYKDATDLVLVPVGVTDE